MENAPIPLRLDPMSRVSDDSSRPDHRHRRRNPRSYSSTPSFHSLLADEADLSLRPDDEVLHELDEQA